VILAIALALAQEATGLDPRQVVGEPAQGPLAGNVLHDEARRISLLLRCPTCQGMSVAESPAEGARAMRDEVERLVAQGYDESQVLDYFVASYGEFILLRPRREGANLTLWIVPALLAAGGIAAVAMQARRRASLPAPPPPASTVDDYRARAEREIDSA